eukprot:2763462-Amphidinium_carterae.2
MSPAVPQDEGALVEDRPGLKWQEHPHRLSPFIYDAENKPRRDTSAHRSLIRIQFQSTRQHE